ncbi:hypothetical protein FQR65_LT20940 [Abscondita terminalis]|nr:hypothetical protein FQR65_LT20940 [Abscondita terminalis]
MVSQERRRGWPWPRVRGSGRLRPWGVVIDAEGFGAGQQAGGPRTLRCGRSGYQEAGTGDRKVPLETPVVCVNTSWTELSCCRHALNGDHVDDCGVFRSDAADRVAAAVCWWCVTQVRACCGAGGLTSRSGDRLDTQAVTGACGLSFKAVIGEIDDVVFIDSAKWAPQAHLAGPWLHANGRGWGGGTADSPFEGRYVGVADAVFQDTSRRRSGIRRSSCIDDLFAMCDRGSVALAGRWLK